MNDKTVAITISASNFIYNTRDKKLITIYNNFTIGRAQGDITFHEDKLLSSSHCKFNFEDKKTIITDLNSTNGTKVNGKKISSYELRQNDSIEIGNLIFIFSKTKNINDFNFAKNKNTATQNKIPKELFKSYFKLPFEIKNYPLSLVFYIFLTLIFLIFAVIFIYDNAITSGLYYNSLYNIILLTLTALISFYISAVFFFWIISGYINVFFKSKWIRFTTQTLLILIPCPIIMFLSFWFFASINNLNNMARINDIDFYCKKNFVLIRCIRVIDNLVDNEKIVASKWHVHIIKNFDNNLSQFIKNQNSINSQTKDKIILLQQTYRDHLNNKQYYKYKKTMQEINKIFRILPVNNEN